MDFPFFFLCHVPYSLSILRIVSHMEHKVFSEDEVFISSMMQYFTKMMTEEITLSESVC